jgi:hypothetical protein
MNKTLALIFFYLNLNIWAQNTETTKPNQVKQKTKKDQQVQTINIFKQIHRAPIVLIANKELASVQYHRIEKYRVFKTEKDGSATPIPFQIDEKDQFGDYILKDGKNPNTKSSNNVFDYQDELSIMGEDVGRVLKPSKWNFTKPNRIYEVIFTNGSKKGAIYIGIYFRLNKNDKKSDDITLSSKNYVDFDLKSANITTSRYFYQFNKKNYLVVRNVDVLSKTQGKTDLLNSSTVYLKLDFKYFLTFSFNQSDIESELDAYKIGPVRVITRVNFSIKILKIKFNLGMYTEVSFFSNAVLLPAIIDNPLNSGKSLNSGSLFYYGFALNENPSNLDIKTNMPFYKKSSFLNNLFSSTTSAPEYWMSAIGEKYMLYVLFKPSSQMLEDKNIPKVFVEKASALQLKKRKKDASPLGESNVNVAISFDMQGLREGIHNISFKLFIDNKSSQEKLNEYATLDKWGIKVRKIR